MSGGCEENWGTEWGGQNLALLLLGGWTWPGWEGDRTVASLGISMLQLCPEGLDSHPTGMQMLGFPLPWGWPLNSVILCQNIGWGFRLQQREIGLNFPLSLLPSFPLSFPPSFPSIS